MANVLIQVRLSKADKVLTFNVCCNNCVKKASKDVKGLIKKVKAGNKSVLSPVKQPKEGACCFLLWQLCRQSKL